MLHHHIQAFDKECDENFDEAWNERYAPALLDKTEFMAYWRKLSQMDLGTPENQGEIDNPNIITLPIGNDITLTVEFHPCCTNYFLNDILIGEVSGNFHLKYITYPELMQITKQTNGVLLFHLLLPMVAIREQEKDIAFKEIVRRLRQIPLYAEHCEYIGRCILTGLLIPDNEIQEIPEIGTICTSNHSYRNALEYSEDKQDIKELNILMGRL